jgi:putative ABC transport system substrate-binding protein
VKRRSFIGVGVASLIALPMAARAQPSSKLPRIGFLNNSNPTIAAPSVEAFQQGLRDLGWLDGKNVTIVYRWADGDMGADEVIR